VALEDKDKLLHNHDFNTLNSRLKMFPQIWRIVSLFLSLAVNCPYYVRMSWLYWNILWIVKRLKFARFTSMQSTTEDSYKSSPIHYHWSLQRRRNVSHWIRKIVFLWPIIAKIILKVNAFFATRIANIRKIAYTRNEAYMGISRPTFWCHKINDTFKI